MCFIQGKVVSRPRLLEVTPIVQPAQLYGL